MFRSQNVKLNFLPKDGDQCVLKGQVSIYVPRGDYQLIVKTIEPAGSGNLMQKFEALRKKLDLEGLFNNSKKLKIPSCPKHVGIVTSSSTAAFQDIISTVKRRSPSSQISISEATVQGDNAHVSIIKALNRIINFNEVNPDNKIDVVILSRGGGSIEDLWCFNNEELAREIYSFPIPTISGVGHEIDFTISDNIDFDHKLNKLLVKNYFNLVISFSNPFIIDKKHLDKSISINFHPGKLPGYRGSFSTVHSMINGEKQVGGTWHYIDEKVDMGNIIKSVNVSIKKKSTSFSLNHQIFEKGIRVFDNVLKLVESENEGVKQKKNQGKFYLNKFPDLSVIEDEDLKSCIYSIEGGKDNIKGLSLKDCLHMIIDVIFD